jgi:hypothetical protein
LISEQEFLFKGAGVDIVSPFMKEAIKAVHRDHMEDFKDLAENQ